MIKNATRNQKLDWVLLIVHLIVLTYLVFFAESLGRSGGEQSACAYNLELFREIKRPYTHREQLDAEAVFLNLGGNVIGFIPFGFILPIISHHEHRWYNVFMLASGLGLGIETIQFIFKVGSFDVDNLLLNTIKGILSCIVYRLVQRFQIKRKRRARESRVDKV